MNQQRMQATLPHSESSKATEVLWHRVAIESFGGPEVISIVEEESIPTPEAYEVLVRVLATSACFTDTIVRRGRYVDVPRKVPVTLGYDFVGVIEAIGADVTGLNVGDWVADLTMIGSNATYVCRPANCVVLVPPLLDPAEAVSMVLTYTTAYQMFHRVANVQKGERILVHGGGGAVGTALLELGKLYGVEMIATASSKHHSLIRQRGAIPIDYNTADFRDAVMEATNGEGVDVVFDFLNLEHFKMSASLLRKGGRLVEYGMHGFAKGEGTMGQGISAWFRMNLWNTWTNLLPTGKSASFYSITKYRNRHPQHFREDLTSLFHLLREGKLQPLVSKRLPLTEARQAHEWMEEGGVEGKIVLLP